MWANSSARQIGVAVRGNAGYGAVLLDNRETIENSLGEPVTWTDEGTPEWKIEVIRRADPTVPEEWPAQHQWQAGWLEKFIRVLKPYL